MRAIGLAFACLLGLASLPAEAAQLTVLTGGATEAAEQSLAAAFTAATGNRVIFVAGTTGQIQQKLKDGMKADIVIIAAPAIAALAQSGDLDAASVTPLGRVGIGVGVKAGTLPPDISTPEKFKQALLDAKSITYMDPAAGASSGIAMAKILKDMGIADEVAKKTVLQQSGFSAERVASGEAELAIQNVSEIVPVKGVQLAGPLPAPLQVYTAYAGALTTQSANSKPAAAFLRYLARPEAGKTWNVAGVEPAVAQ